MNRIIVPGGQVIVLEMTPNESVYEKDPLSLPESNPSQFGQTLSLNPAAYHYLADSIINFPVPGEMMEKAGLRKVEIIPLPVDHSSFIYYKPESKLFHLDHPPVTR
jgi:demethylmenaquinone methyltransferase/2-methoxy-6-polyprenyl-1,4-benzoquinol methylase